MMRSQRASKPFPRRLGRPRRSVGIALGFTAAGVGSDPNNQLGAGLYMARDPEEAVPFAFDAKQQHGRCAMLWIVIRTSDWVSTIALGAQDNVPMTRGPLKTPTGGKQSFVPLGPALTFFENKSLYFVATYY